MTVKLIIRQTWVKLPKSVWCSSAFSIKLITNVVDHTLGENLVERNILSNLIFIFSWNFAISML